jgi:hypothetical protein
MVYIKIGVPDIIFEELVKSISCQELGDNRARKVHKIDGKYYITSGAIYSGGGVSLPVELSGHEVVPLELHKGPTYTYEQLWINGSRGYFHGNNQKFSCRGKEWVVVPYIKVDFHVTIVQSTMF